MSEADVMSVEDALDLLGGGNVLAGPTAAALIEYRGDELNDMHNTLAGHIATLEASLAQERQARGELEKKLNTPELHDFAQAVVLEAAHQRERWGVEHDVGKQPADWFWLVGYLAGKALASHIGGNTDKALHHCISTSAALANWHAALKGDSNTMQPGHAPSAALGAALAKAPT